MGRVIQPGKPAPLPTAASIDGWHKRLLSSGEPLDYLLTERGLTVVTIRRHRIGYDGEAFTIPIYSPRRRLVNVRRRWWPSPYIDRDGGEHKYTGLRGRNRDNGGVQLYPSVPRRGLLVLCEGEFDALLLRRHGLQGVTGTVGTGWLERWNGRVEGRRLAVLYDAGDRAEAAAVARASAIRNVGAVAWPVRLSRAGLRPNEDVTDWFVRYGYSADALKELVRVEWTRYRRRRSRRHG